MASMGELLVMLSASTDTSSPDTPASQALTQFFTEHNLDPGMMRELAQKQKEDERFGQILKIHETKQAEIQALYNISITSLEEGLPAEFEQEVGPLLAKMILLSPQSMDHGFRASTAKDEIEYMAEHNEYEINVHGQAGDNYDEGLVSIKHHFGEDDNGLPVINIDVVYRSHSINGTEYDTTLTVQFPLPHKLAQQLELGLEQAQSDPDSPWYEDDGY